MDACLKQCGRSVLKIRFGKESDLYQICLQCERSLKSGSIPAPKQTLRSLPTAPIVIISCHGSSTKAEQGRAKGCCSGASPPDGRQLPLIVPKLALGGENAEFDVKWERQSLDYKAFLWVNVASLPWQKHHHQKST